MKSKAVSPALPLVKSHWNTVPLVAELASRGTPAAGLSVSIDLSAAKLLLLSAVGNVAALKVPPSATDVTSAVSVSAVSMSVTVKLPLVLIVESVSVNDAASPEVVSLPLITGVSLVPTRVTVTVSTTLSGAVGSSSATVTV